MRWIDIRKLNPSQSWRTKAQIKQRDIDEGVCEAKTGQSIWSELKPALKKLSNNKCWYCESREDRSDNTVDHFRPKSIYPWFALDYENFRFACTFCNSIRTNPETGESEGKGDHFPLLSGSRATNRIQRNTEAFVLLDPCKATDASLLDFCDDGRPRPKYPNEKTKNQRVIDSISYYHLDHPDLNEERRLLALEIRDLIETGDELYPDLNSGIDSVGKSFETVVDSLARLIVADAPFSVFAKKMVKGYQNREWVEDILECA
ncbi:HNH endonuclease [Hydrogenovibrio kuenenii]|uniref:HNH endonuclease n=1 Tax=Hydrogenovibrio kuenenii TaxID=63658 RepID=UPI000466C26C|nr:HNH endonuclease [Hydrogenovibrio kuenenii]